MDNVQNSIDLDLKQKDGEVVATLTFHVDDPAMAARMVDSLHRTWAGRWSRRVVPLTAFDDKERVALIETRGLLYEVFQTVL